MKNTEYADAMKSGEVRMSAARKMRFLRNAALVNLLIALGMPVLDSIFDTSASIGLVILLVQAVMAFFIFVVIIRQPKG